ncbi:ATPase AAA [Brevibacillus panacihumi W25]|uniref:ATPase AAA n=1 Tax=Brevibacillus panacihumi W25 TaxID=1408254 RepID=V6MB21_9BACL|nr:ATP-binding protein [Brevibacillus panacihumi]EST55776.1 ATPase AAA [Brevibacillus panacihumi W25]
MIIRPNVPTGLHPIETGTYLVATHKIDSMFEVIQQWYDERATGGIIFGRPRLGKSRAIKYIIQTLPLFLEREVPIFHICCKQYKQPNPGEFFEDLLRGVGHAFASSGKPSAKRDRLTKFLIERAESTIFRRIIMFIDDAQLLHELHYGWLMDIYNELDRIGITLTVILVGQEELEFQRSAFLASKKTQIVGRFMVKQHKFSGIESVEELRVCLTGYDEDCEYPMGSGWSFTRYFFPEAFAEGYKLSQCTDDLIELYEEKRKNAGIKTSFEIPMQYVTATIEYAFKKFGANGKGVECLNKSHWSEAIDKSGYIDSEIYYEIAL